MGKEEPIRIAQIMGKWVGGGLESIVMNYYKNIDRKKIQFDFFFDEDSVGIPYEEIESMGGKIIIIPPYQRVFKYHKKLKKELMNGNYQIVHSHLNTLSVFSLYAAKRAGVPIRIAHSHSTTNKKEWKKNIVKIILRLFVKKFATNYMACTEHAGRWMFGNKEYDKGNVYVLNNAINIDEFMYNEDKRNQKRQELGIDDKYVIGHIGRFVEQKNHRFLIEVFNKLHKRKPNTILMLIGQGPLLDNMKEKVKGLRIEEAVLFAGQRKDVNDFYQAMDLFLFPSLYEGLGMVMVEAQCSGLPCIASTEVPIVARVNNNVDFLRLDEEIDIWVNKIEEYMLKDSKRSTDAEMIKLAGYSIDREAYRLEEVYFKLLNKLLY